MTATPSVTAFLAYPSNPTVVGDSLDTFREEINGAGEVKITSWTELSGGGRLLIDAIVRTIDSSDLIIADLTSLNFNVLFEVGYAIARGKRVWFTLNNSRNGASDAVDKFAPLSTYGQARYRNSVELVQHFYRDLPYRSLEKTILQESVVPRLSHSSDEFFLYFKLPQNDESAVRVSNRLDRRIVPYITIDSTETPSLSFEVVAPRIFNASAVLVHVPAEAHRSDPWDVAQHALFAGFAHGLAKPLLLLRERGPAVALDYRSLLYPYTSSHDAAAAVDRWLTPIEAGWLASAKKRASAAHVAAKAALLHRFLPAEYVAENETGVLEQYFVPTAPYLSALRGQTGIFVGRKGTGKTANLIRIAQELRHTRDALPIVVKPPSFEMQTIVQQLTTSAHSDSRGYVIESMWKALLVTEIAKAVEHDLQQWPGKMEKTASLTKLLNANGGALREDFAVRLERMVHQVSNRIAQLDSSKNTDEFRVGISESLHSTTIRDLRMAIGEAWHGERRIAVLVDNLDKAWDKAVDLDSVSEALLALLSVPDRIVIDFNRDDSRRRPIHISLALFLRSDIYQKVRANAQEPDKISVHELRWRDASTLLRVLEARMVHFGGKDTPTANDAWAKLIVPSMRGASIKKWLVDQVVSRPRDLIYLFNAAVISAINHGSARIEEIDLLSAKRDYSKWALLALQVENGISPATLQLILAEFLAAPAVMTKSMVLDAIQRVSPPIDPETAFTHLGKLGFLGLQTGLDRFEWALDPSDYDDISLRAVRFAGTGQVVASIAEPYRDFLEIRA